MPNCSRSAAATPHCGRCRRGGPWSRFRLDQRPHQRHRLRHWGPERPAGLTPHNSRFVLGAPRRNQCLRRGTLAGGSRCVNWHAHCSDRRRGSSIRTDQVRVGFGGNADMQGDQEMTFDSESALSAAPRTTAVGLEAWLSGVHAEDLKVEDIKSAIIEAPEPMQVEATEVEVGPVNAAEALALALVQGTFSSPRKLIGPDGAELVVDPEKDVYHFEATALKIGRASCRERG